MNLPQQDWVFAMVQFVFFPKYRPAYWKKKALTFGLLDIYDFSCNLVVTSTSKFFNDNKIAWARRASAICSLSMRFVVFFMYITMTYYRLELYVILYYQILLHIVVPSTGRCTLCLPMIKFDGSRLAQYSRRPLASVIWRQRGYHHAYSVLNKK